MAAARAYLLLLPRSPDQASTMNSLYTLGVRQTNSIQADLERLRTGDMSASLLGQCSPTD